MKLKPTLKYAEEPDLNELVIVKKINDWLVESRAEPVPKMLFGEFWLEGELAVLAADSGAGKSLLAVQIAESIARGHALEPMKMTAKPQKVLYLDFKLSQKQFEMRYADEIDAEDREFLTNHHKFSGNLKRVVIDPKAKLPDKYRGFDEVLPRLVEALVHKNKARVVIIDNITNLQRSIYGYREIFTIMSGLNALKRRLGISILVLARTSRHDASRPTAIGRSTAVFSRFVDSMFTIGQSKLDTAGRYIKQIAVRSTEKLYDASHVPSYRLARINGNFLGFEYQSFASESVHLGNARDHLDWPLIDKIHEMSEEGMSIREIAAELEMPKTNVHRMLQLWTPEGQEAAAEAEAEVPPVDKYYFPGREEYDEAGEDPKFDDIYDREDDEAYRLRSESYLIEAACAKARQEYLKTGTAPKLVEMLERMSVPPAVAGGLTQVSQSICGSEAHCSDDSNIGHLQPPATAGGTDSDPTNPFPGTRRATDEYGKEIFIEKEDERGKRQIWLNFDSKGSKQRFVRKGNGVTTITQIE